MFKKVTKIALAGIIGVGTMVGSSSLVSAEPAGYDSDATIKFEIDNTGTPPLDPMEPDLGDPVEPGDRNDREPETNEGGLSIDYASNFDFGTFDITSAKQERYAKPVQITLDGGGTKTVAPYVQITDKSGKNEGWNLKVKHSPFMNGENELSGAQISLVQEGTVTVTPGTDISTVTGSEGTAEEEFILNENTNSLFKADEPTPGGTFINSFGKNEESEAVKLTIPAGTQIDAAEYEAIVTWTLENGPETP